MKKFNVGWYVLYTRPRHEVNVSQELDDMQLSYYLATKRIFRIWHDRKRYVSTPVFPSYIFVYLRNSHDYFEALRSKGVLRYVRFGKEIAKVSDEVIHSLRTITDSGREFEVMDGLYTAGQKLFIKEGPLAGINCEVVSVGSKKKIQVRVELLQRTLLMELSSDQICVS